MLARAVVVAAFAASFTVCAQDAGASGDAAEEAAMNEEIRYIEALTECGYAYFADIQIAKVKKRFPAADTKLFALEIRAMLGLGDFEGAEKKIASLPDRTGAKFWGARLELANYLFAYGRKKECSTIYDEFFKKFATPPKELREFYEQALYAWGQILIGDKRFEEAAGVYMKLRDQIDKDRDEDTHQSWCAISAETAEMYLKLADEAPAEKRAGFLAPTKKIVDDLLWEEQLPVYFGRAIAMKAHMELLKGNVKGAQETINEYMDQLASIHQQIVDFDPKGQLGHLRQSPMPLCRYLLADLLWKEAQAEYKKVPKRDDERVKSLLFGEKVGGKRNGSGAYNHALNVFIKYPESVWSASAGDLAEEIRLFVEKNYKTPIKTSVTPEQMAKVRAMQFEGANEKFNEGDYKGAVADYLLALSHMPEGRESIFALENLVVAYRKLSEKAENETDKELYRLDCDAVEGYLAERFAGNADRSIMTAGGDATLRAMAAEKQRGEEARAKALLSAFVTNYRRHVNAGNVVAAAAQEAYEAEDFAEAIRLDELMGRYYTNNTYYAGSLTRLSASYRKTGERQKALDAMKRYVEVEPNRVRGDLAQMSLAQMYKDEGFEIINGAETNETPELVAQQLKKGSAQIVRGIQQFRDFAAKAEKALKNPALSKADRASYTDMSEGALFLVGDCWSRLQKPEAKLNDFRARAAENFETYVEKYPQGKYACAAYVKLGSIYTALGDMEKSRAALDRLAKEFPDSPEAKNAMPRLAKTLIEMGLKKEGTGIYAEMMKTDGKYSATQFLSAGEALIEARSWELANQAFEKAINRAATNQTTIVAKALIGEAKALYRKGALAEAREAIDRFLEDDKNTRMAIAAEAYLLLVDVASEQGRVEKESTARARESAASSLSPIASSAFI